MVPGISYLLIRLLVPASPLDPSVPSLISGILVSTLGSGILVSIVGSSEFGRDASVEGMVVGASVVGVVVAAVVGAVVALVVGVGS